MLLGLTCISGLLETGLVQPSRRQALTDLVSNMLPASRLLAAYVYSSDADGDVLEAMTYFFTVQG